ncbi:hypothetical protein KP79_PYT25055 [Mizuhopecten yessoensis]|uniref:Uncharacterized protein n=1 Tax=Mizuhopecten yessoensis TaxID=6573 RepID=A0A210PY61_MIZYE|nr:hypothetical protein KP79_PYT25055 [Mizuhopecten yessoensis]
MKVLKRPKSGETTPTPHKYHKKSMNCIRVAINRYIQDIGREMDIVNGTEFKRENKFLDGLLKEK